ncbi:hypothetical protein L1049_025931 [Liquidambar formosana]|uniref:R13L1/DRL21-like LRR repeat region domain-containing protein n=1 Tax=Liquidambar formosana TaxID=63359 RepID=A0AAP0NDU4_LIQFO
MKLQSLGLSWREDNEGKLERYSSRPAAERPNAFHHEERVLRWLQPNGILRRLSITGYSGITFPEWFNGVALPNLTEVVLINCRRCEVLPTLGQLPFLKVLIMQGMDAVVEIDSRFYGEGGDKRLFPSLKELTLRDFPSLRSWESIDLKEAFTCLERLSIIKCPEIHDSSVLHGNLAQTRHASVICNFNSSLIPNTMYEAKKLHTLNLLSLRDDFGIAFPTIIRVFNTSEC